MNATTAFAVLMAVLSAACYAAGAVAQERLAMRSASRGYGWWLAFGGNAAGAVLHLLALGYGALTVVQPLGALTLVVALPLGALATGRRVRRVQWRGAALTVAGLGVLLALVPAGAAADALGSGEPYALVAVVAAVVAGMLWWTRRADRPVVRALLYGVAAGISFALASVLTQTVVLRWAQDGPAGLASPVTVLLGVAAAAGVLLSQAAYRGAGLAVPLTALTLANPVAAAVIGMALLGEGYTGGTPGALAAVLAAAVIARGVVLLTGADPETTGAREPARSAPAAGTGVWITPAGPPAPARTLASVPG